MPKHIFLEGPPESRSYTSIGQRGPKPNLPSRSRVPHAQTLRNQFEAIRTAWELRQRERQALSLPARQGCYIEVRGRAGFDLVHKSLEDIGQGIRLLQAHPDGDPPRAVIYVPDGKQGVFLEKLRQYEEEETAKKGEPKNKNLIEGIEDIRLAVLESLWNDPRDLLPGAEPKWVEVWLNVDREEASRDQQIEEFRALLDRLGLPAPADEALHFPERSILLVLGNEGVLTSLIESSDLVAEFRLAKETARFFLELPPADQAEWVSELLIRVRVTANGSVGVCVLDTGTNHGHALLAPVISGAEVHTVDVRWGTDDGDGHGTLMSGLAAYGDLRDALEARGPVILAHRVESVKILPPHGFDPNPKHLWGDMTKRGAAHAEIASPDRKRVFSLAVTATDDRDRGKPSSWSGAVDQIASDPERRRLVIVASGNADITHWGSYPDSNLTDQVHDPGQAWNALTVGAYTAKSELTDPALRAYRPLAPSDGLSPFSTTSATWDQKKWPIKPEIVMEGGNLVKDSDGLVSQCDDLSLISTHFKPTERQFTSANMTSAATALAARMAAQIQAAYPDAWPETIRALMVHSAEWTDTMRSQFAPGGSKQELRRLLRICGYGVPRTDRAIEYARNTVSLVSQQSLQPFDRKEGGGYRSKEMHFYELPWPTAVLQQLPADLDIQMRVTLSYFIEPSPGEIGWKDRYRYQSHALRFDINSPTESRDTFIARVNAEARDDEEETSYDSGSDRWRFGKKTRDVGSVHSDLWEGSAADIAACKLVAVYPVIGWWRERPQLQRWDSSTRYSLVVSLHSPAQSVDLYTPVAIQLGIQIPT